MLVMELKGMPVLVLLWMVLKVKTPFQWTMKSYRRDMALVTGMELSHDVCLIPVVHSTSVGISTDPVIVSTPAVLVALSAASTVSGTVSVPTVSGSVSVPSDLGIVSAATTGLSPVTISAANTGLVPFAGFESTTVTPLTVSTPTSALSVFQV